MISNELQKNIMQSNRLHLPLEFVQEALHSGAVGGTIFPMPCGMSSTWNVGKSLQLFIH